MVEDNIRYRWGLMEILAKEETLQIVEEASDGDEALEKARNVKPHVVLMDLHMPNCDGFEATRRLQAEMPETKALILTVSESGADLVNALKAGARGYLLKNEKPDQIVQAIHYVARGGILVSPLMAAKLLGEIQPSQPVEEGNVSRIQIELPAQADVATEEEEKLPIQQAIGKPAETTAEQPQLETEDSLGSLTTEARDTTVTEVDLVISPPLEPGAVLKLHKWLTEVAKGDIGKIDSSLGGEAVLSVTFREQTHLVPMLTGLSYVAEVIEEPYSKKTGLSGSPLEGSKRLRLVLKS